MSTLRHVFAAVIRKRATRRQLVTVVLFAVALLLYAFGLDADANGLIVVGICLEGTFWMHLARKTGVRPSTLSACP